MNQSHGPEVVRRRGLTAGDLAAAQELAALCDQHEGLELPLNLSTPEVLGEGDCDQLLYSQDGALIGFLSLDQMSEIEICMAVHPEHRRRGIGSALLAAARERCRQRGKASFLLVTDEASPSGRAFVGAMGAEYRDSEYRMRLDRERFPGVPPGADSLTVAPAGVDDYARIRQVTFGGSLEEARQRVAQDFQRPNQQSYLARLDGEPIGTIRTGSFDSRVYITAFAVLPEYRGRGYGRWILSRAVAGLIEANREQIFIEVATENRNALSLYRSCGFVEQRTYGFYHLAV
jgi:ribosomal protein S18 acetylase RimI-like enzyme